MARAPGRGQGASADSLTAAARAELARLEEAMWREATRFEAAFQATRFASDMIEIGRSGRRYARAELLHDSGPPIGAELPLAGLEIRALGADAGQVLYHGVVRGPAGALHAWRSAIGSRTPAGWVMRFQQGTPFVP